MEGWQNADKVGILTGWSSEWETKANPKSRLFVVAVANFQNAKPSIH
jgi:hypothetical protein